MQINKKSQSARLPDDAPVTDQEAAVIQPVSPRNGASPSPNTTKQKTARVVPLWEAAKTLRPSSAAHDAGRTR